MRQTYADHLKNIGREDLLDGRLFACVCRRKMDPASLFDVRDEDDVDGEFCCAICTSAKDREAAAAAEAALPWPTEEQLNDLRAARDVALLRSDWTQLPDNQARLSEAERQAWIDYRQQWRDLVTAAKEGRRVDPPVPPS